MSFKSKLMMSSAAVFAGSALVPGLAYAQSDQDDASSEDVYEEIMVTASRRTKTLSEVPSNISALTGEMLEDAGVTDFGGFTRLVPGLVMRDEGPRVSGNQNSLVLRGLNATGQNNQDDDPAQTQQAVSTYFGETPVFFPLKLIDVKRVEVLRGPQGTLYGSGSVGGTVRIIPNAPSTDSFYGEFNAQTSTTAHSDDPGYRLSGVLNFPLSSTTALRVSGGYNYYGGFIDALGLVQVEKSSKFDPGVLVLEDPSDFLGSPAAAAPPLKDVNNAEVYFARAALRYEPSDSFDATLSYVFQKNSANDRAEHNPLFGTFQNYVQYKDSREPQDAEIHLGSLETHIDVGFAQMTTATSYAETDVISISDSSGFLRTVIPQYYFGFPRVIAPILRIQKTAELTQEVRLVSTGDGPIEWLVGAFFNRNELDFAIPQKVDGISDFVNLLYGLNPPLDFGDVLATGGTNKTGKELAGYGEVTWNATDRLSLTGGVRVFRTTLHGEGGIPLPFASRTASYYYGDPLDSFLFGGIEPINFSDTGKTFRANAAYDLSETALVYATWAQGYRRGGSNPLPLTDAGGNDNTPFLTYKPDTLNSYEVGIKGRVDRINYSTAVYWINWKDMQQPLVIPGGFGVPFIGNVPKARSRGFELSLDGQVTTNLNLALGYSYTDAEVTKSFLLNANLPGSLVQAGAPLPGAAKHSATAALDYRVPLGNDMGISLHGDLSYLSKSQSTFQDIDIIVDGVDQFPDDMFILFPSSTVINLSTRLEWDNISVTLFADNVTSELGTHSGSASEFFGAKSEAFGILQPFTAGLRVKYEFGN